MFFVTASPGTTGLPDIRVETSLNIPRININGKGLEAEGEPPGSHRPPFSHEDDIYSPNLKRPSPDEPENKVSIADLKHQPPSPDSGGARPRCSKSVVTEEEKEKSKKGKSEAPLAKSIEGEDDLSGGDSITPTPNSPLLQDQGSPLTQRAARHSQWSRQRDLSEGGGWKVSFDDSLTQTLMASFEHVPELTGHVDMDSTSCSVCSSEDVSIASHLSSAGPSPVATSGSGPSTARDNTQVYSPLPQVLPPPPHVFADNNDEDDDPTLASSSDSFTLEGGIPEVPSLDSSPGSEGMSGLSATVSPHSSGTSPPLSSSNNGIAADEASHPSHLLKSSSNSTDHSQSSQPSPTTLSAPLPAQHSSADELAHSAKPFTSLGELRKESLTHQRPIQHWKAESSQLMSSRTEKQVGLGRGPRWPFSFEISQPHHSQHEGSQASSDKSKPYMPPTIGLQLGDSKPRSKAQKSSGQRCYIRGRNKSRHSGTKS